MSLKTLANRFVHSMSKAAFHVEVVNLGGHLKLNIADSEEEVTVFPEEWERAQKEAAPSIKQEGGNWEEKKLSAPTGHFTRGQGFNLSNPKVGTLQPRPKVYVHEESPEERAHSRAQKEAAVAARRAERLASQPKGRRESAPQKYGKK